MARAGILYSHVAKAAAQLAAAGKNPTVDNVREQLGGTGSKSTIAPLLKQWKAQHQGETAAAGAGLPMDLLEAVKGVYERMQADAQRQVEQARVEHLAALEAVQEQLRQCQAHDGMLSQSAASLSAELAQTKEALARLQGAHHAEQITVATLRSDNAGMEQRLADRAMEVKALVEQLAQTRVQFEHFQEAIAAQRLEDRRAFDRHAGRLEHDLASTQQQLGQLRAEHAARVDDVRAAREELTMVLADRVQLTRQLAEAATSAETVAGKLERASQDVVEARIAIAAQQGQAELLMGQLAGVGAERDKLTQEILTLVQDNAALREHALAAGKRTKPSEKSGA
jgi:chromosome segregation ATPase